MADFVWSGRSKELNVRRTPATGAAELSLTTPVICDPTCPGTTLPPTSSDIARAHLSKWIPRVEV
jgi:hypothetical protein